MRRETRHLSALLLLLASGIAYHNSLAVPFLFDDLSSIVRNDAIRTLWPPWALLASTRPVVELSLALNYALGRLDVWGYHAFNLFIHLSAGLTLLGILRRTFGRPGLAFSAALLWIVHPLQTQSVTYITQRAESMMGLFYLLTLYAALRAHHSGHPHRWWAFSILACALGAGSKAIIVTAPLAVMLYDRSFLFRSWKEAWSNRTSLYLGLLSTWVLLIHPLTKLLGVQTPTAGFGMENIPWLTYASTQPEVILHYLRLAVLPHPLVFDYAWQPVPVWTQALAPAFALGGLLAGALWLWRRMPTWGFWALWFFLTLAPSSSFMPVADLAVEHRMYLPLVGVVTLVTFTAADLSERMTSPESLRRKIAAGVVVALAATLCGLTTRRNHDYRSEISIWSDTLAKRPENPRAYMQLGKSLAIQGAYDRAIPHLKRALQLKPDFLAAHNNLGNVRAQQGRWEEALAHYKAALAIHPDFVDARVNLGNALLQLGKVSQAVKQYRKALEIDPSRPELHNNLGVALQMQGDRERAIQHFEEALRLDPTYPRARQNLEAARRMQRRPASASPDVVE